MVCFDLPTDDGFLGPVLGEEIHHCLMKWHIQGYLIFTFGMRDRE